jgi:uncharacterized protein (TIGR02246 family)
MLLLRPDRDGGWPSRKSEALKLWFVGKRQQATRRRHRARRAFEGDLSALDCGEKPGVAEPHPGEAHEISGDDDIDIPARRRFKANLDIFRAQHQPPVARAAIGFRNPAEIEPNDKALRGYFGWTDLPSYSPQEHFRIEVVRTNQPLCPALAPYAHQLDNRPEILSGWRQSIEMTFALGFRLDVDHAVLLKLLEAMREDRARYERRGIEQLAKSPRAKAQLTHNDRGPAIAEHFGRFGYWAELRVADHAGYDPPVRAVRQVRFTYLSAGVPVSKIERFTRKGGCHAIFKSCVHSSTCAVHRIILVCLQRFARAESGSGGGDLGMGQALGEDDPEKVLAFYSDDAVLWGTLSPTVRSDRAALRDYFVTAFKALPGLKVAFGDQLIRVYGSAAINTGYYTFSYVKDGETKSLPARYSFTYVKSGERWLIVDHHSSAMPSPPG